MADKSIQVTPRQVFTTKKDKEQGAEASLFNTVSIPDSRSNNGFSTFPALKSDISVREDKRCDVVIHTEQQYDLSYPTGEKQDNGKAVYKHERVSGQNLIDLLQENLGKKKEQEHTKNVFINNVSDQFISPVKGKEGQPELVRFSMKGADDRYMSILLPKQNAEIPSTDKAGVRIADHHNINLGAEDSSYKCSVRGKDGKFEYFQMTAGEIKTQYDANQKAYIAARRAKDKEVEVATPAEFQPQVIDESQFAID